MFLIYTWVNLAFSKLVIWGSSWGGGLGFHWLWMARRAGLGRLDLPERSLSLSLSLSLYIYIYIYICILYTYSYHVFIIWSHVNVYIYIYIYILLILLCYILWYYIITYYTINYIILYYSASAGHRTLQAHVRWPVFRWVSCLRACSDLCRKCGRREPRATSYSRFPEASTETLRARLRLAGIRLCAKWSYRLNNNHNTTITISILLLIIMNTNNIIDEHTGVEAPLQRTATGAMHYGWQHLREQLQDSICKITCKSSTSRAIYVINYCYMLIIDDIINK